MKPKYITQKEFAEYFSISVQTVERLRNEKFIKYIRLPTYNYQGKNYSSMIRIPVSEIEAYEKLCNKHSNA